MKTLLTTAAILAVATTTHADDTKHFEGSSLGGEVGYLSGDGPTGTYYGGTLGLRKQTDSNIVFGLEGTVGTTSTGYYFDESDSENFYKIQWSAMGTVGYASGRNLFSVGTGFARAYSSYVYYGIEEDASYNALAGMVSYERAIGDHLSIRARVMTYKFDNYISSIGLALRF